MSYIKHTDSSLSVLPAGPSPVALSSASAVPLGTITKIGSTPKNPEVEAINRFETATLHKYALRSVVRQALPTSRCAACGRFILPGQRYVSVRAAAGRASVNQLAVCGSVWACPVCSSKVSEYRRRELSTAVKTCAAEGLPVALLTLTLRHHSHHSLRQLLAALKRAWLLLMRSRTGKELKALGLIGWIRAFEITRSDLNGWHPHLHVLLVLDRDTPIEPLAEVIEQKWCAVLAGLGHPSNEHAVQITAADTEVARYVSKYGEMGSDWDVAAEMSKSHVKRGRAASMTPFDLLRAVVLGNGASGPLLALYREYVEATKGLHQLQWSRGLRALLLPDELEISDEEIAEKAGEDMPEVARLDQEQWTAIYAAHAVGEMLVYVARTGGDRLALSDWLRSHGIRGSTWVL